ncbi:hypothetical protein, partial [Micromonospora aurantiaca (nom. illeg.)]|uniref:hypothetical protein n=1 Tax=Micromonospora aurantiaca (nom. illeg.) TaxID=47850 RepID=UPI003655EF32
MGLEDWLEILFQGSAGAILSLVGLFSVFYLTQRHEKRREQAREDRADKRRRKERTLKNAADVLEQGYGLRVFGITDKSGQWELSVVQALTRFSVEESVDHPKIANWARQKAFEVLKMYEEKLASTLSYEVGKLTGFLARWVAEDMPNIEPSEFMKSSSRDQEIGSSDRNNPLYREVIRTLQERGKPLTFENVDRALRPVRLRRPLPGVHGQPP